MEQLDIVQIVSKLANQRTASLKCCTLNYPIGHKTYFQTWQRRMSNCSIDFSYHIDTHWKNNLLIYLLWKNTVLGSWAE